MYDYAASDSILSGVSNIYLVSIATALLAVIIALYFSNLLKEDENGIVVQSASSSYHEGDDIEDEYLSKESQMEKLLYTNNDERYMETYSADEMSSDEYDDEDLEYFKRNYGTSTETNTDDEIDVDHDIHKDGLVSKIKSNRVKELEANLTRDQLEEERRIEREQLAAIFELLKKQEAELNMKEIDESELNAQLSLYR
ncbi:matrix-remodeling-associated protein 7 [Musca vetustissima]|uniref:matrix-remodeling-associated protein 7 n=1 Tax=Musca vetustissima TaxID=27455 RepID=UPI002AB6F064|nr:matrix-remodeling-associated protein 7 [Musca vetustissima]